MTSKSVFPALFVSTDNFCNITCVHTSKMKSTSFPNILILYHLYSINLAYCKHFFYFTSIKWALFLIVFFLILQSLSVAKFHQLCLLKMSYIFFPTISSFTMFIQFFSMICVEYYRGSKQVRSPRSLTIQSILHMVVRDNFLKWNVKYSHPFFFFLKTNKQMEPS